MRLITLTVGTFLFFAPQAQAGFDWTPPSKMPEMAAQAQNPSIDNHAGNSVSDFMAALPPASVTQEPLGYYDAPMPLAMPSAPPVQNLSGKTGLVIDPYPLRSYGGYGGKRDAQLTASSVEQAMAEQAKILHPVQLGAGMTTGAQPISALQVSAPAPTSRRGGFEHSALSRFSGGSTMTPMAGGANVAGYATPRSPSSHGSMAAPAYGTPIKQYAKAVGFGRDLPLALALSQIVPSEFSHAYVGGVDPGTVISWEGGKPWNEVLEETLRSQGFTSSIQGNKVLIKPLS